MFELEPDMRVVAEASNADEAIRQVRAVDPGVILMDIKMPGMDGIETTRRLSKDSPELKILVLMRCVNHHPCVQGDVVARLAH